MAFRDDRVALRARVEQLERELEETREARNEEISDELRDLKEQLARAETELAVTKPHALGAVNVATVFGERQRRVRAFVVGIGAVWAAALGSFLAQQPVVGCAFAALGVLLVIGRPRSECPKCGGLLEGRALGKYCTLCTAQLRE